MEISILGTPRGKVYLLALIWAAIFLMVAPILDWIYYSIRFSSGVESSVTVAVTGFGSIVLSVPGISGVSFTFASLGGWWYGSLTLAVGVLAILASVLAIRRPESGGMIAFILSFFNIPTVLFFLGRVEELTSVISAFVLAIEGAGYTIVGYSSGYSIGFILEVIGTFLLPASSIMVTSTAAKLREKIEGEEARKKRAMEKLSELDH